jgi:hypothetical protein
MNGQGNFCKQFVASISSMKQSTWCFDLGMGTNNGFIAHNLGKFYIYFTYAIMLFLPPMIIGEGNFYLLYKHFITSLGDNITK